MANLPLSRIPSLGLRSDPSADCCTGVARHAPLQEHDSDAWQERAPAEWECDFWGMVRSLAIYPSATLRSEWPASDHSPPRPRHMRVDGREGEITFHYVCSPLIEKGSEGLRHIPVVR